MGRPRKYNVTKQHSQGVFLNYRDRGYTMICMDIVNEHGATIENVQTYSSKSGKRKTPATFLIS